MTDQLGFEPDSLEPRLLCALRRLTREAGTLSIDECLVRAQNHMEEAIAAAQLKPSVNVPLVRALFATCESIVADFDTIPAYAKAWIKGAILYFVETDDDEHDFDSFLGFEDDCQVLNVCLKLAGREDLMINPEDYD